MNLGAQKLDIDERRGQLESHINKLKQDVAILKRGMEELDKGEDMFKGASLLANEVRKIMKDLK
jgi:cell division protein FtsB